MVQTVITNGIIIIMQSTLNRQQDFTQRQMRKGLKRVELGWHTVEHKKELKALAKKLKLKDRKAALVRRSNI